MKTKRFLFFLIHPSKYHVFRNTINTLKAHGHHVDILITSKDVLEVLLKNEGWPYKNIFPEGRKMKGVPAYISAAINTFRTLFRLEKFLFKNKKFDMFITDDLLVINGWWRRIPTVLLQDDDVTAVPETVLLHTFAKHILSPSVSNMKKNNQKKISFYGYKELGSLHPNRFIPDMSIVTQFNPKNKNYFLLRLVSLRSTHDTGKSGLNDNDVEKLIEMLGSKGEIYITSERPLPEKYEKYRINIKPNDIAHALCFAQLLIADSQTMSAEAGVLGTPYIRYNDFVGRISYLEELEQKYELGYGVKTKDKEKLFETLQLLLSKNDIKGEWLKKKQKMLDDKIDLTSFMLWFFEEYPESFKMYKQDPDFQLKFK